jgi:beta-N-acetylhexosaminidase
MTAAARLRRDAAGTLLASFPGREPPAWVLRQAGAGLGGICLYGSNRGADVATVASLLHGVRTDLVVALDEEGGDVTRLEAATGSSVPGNAALGAVDDADLTRSVAAALGRVLSSMGIDLDLAPCADVNSDPSNPVIGVRAFGAEHALVARHTAAFVSGLQSAGVAATAKHFPGHGAVDVDSHVSLPAVTAPVAVLRERELGPFRAAISAGVAAVMAGHLLVPALDPEVPATISRRILTGLLRGELGFGGAVVTDALDMGGIGGPDAIPRNVVRALTAGADLCCLGPDNDEALVDACIAAVAAAVAAGDLAAERVAGAAARTRALARHRERGAVVPPDRRNAPPGAAGDDLARLGAAAAERALRIVGALPRRIVGAHVVELDRPANIAAGPVPWGVAADLAELDPTTTAARVAEHDDRAVDAALAAARHRPLVVVVRDPHRRPAQAAALDTLLAARPDAVVVDVGWPSDRPAGAPGATAVLGDGAPGGRGSGSARIMTHGASRASGRAVARVLAGTPAPGHVPSPTTAGRTARG